MSTKTKNARVHIDDLHFEHEQWKRELNFFKEEYSFFKRRLEEVASRYTSQEVLKDLDHFQNQMYIHGNAIDELLHKINEHESNLSKFAKDHPVAIDHVLFEDHQPLRDEVNRNRELVNEFKHDYQRFLAKWM